MTIYLVFRADGVFEEVFVAKTLEEVKDKCKARTYDLFEELQNIELEPEIEHCDYDSCVVSVYGIDPDGKYPYTDYNGECVCDIEWIILERKI